MSLRKYLNFHKIILGEIQRLFGLPIKDTVTPRLALEQWKKQLNNVPPPKSRVLITALRNETWIEWAVYCACVIRQLGYESTLLYKKDEIDRFYSNSSYFNFWKGVNEIPGIELIDINNLDYDQNVYIELLNENNKSCIAALAYNKHIESADILDNPDQYGGELREFKEVAAKNGARVYNLISKRNFHVFLCYSGLIGETNTLLLAAQRKNLDTVCLEGWGWRKGHMIYNINGPALEYNVKGWMNYFGTWDEKKELEMSQYFSFLNKDGKTGEWLNTFHNVQKASINSELPKHVIDFIGDCENVFLLPCNVIGDSSLLNRETIFKSHRAFIQETVEYFKNRPDAKLIIRAHPGEDWVKTKIAIKIGEYSKSITKGIDNILVINDYEAINTFTLLPYVKAGLVWITSAGVDFVVRGVPVIAAANPKYGGLGIVEEPTTKTDYFDLIDSFIKEKPKVTPEQHQAAKEYLYLVFKGFSFESYGRDFRATGCRLNNMINQKEHDRFYKIIMKEIPAPDKSTNCDK